MLSPLFAELTPVSVRSFALAQVVIGCVGVSSGLAAEMLGAEQLARELGGHTIKGYYTHNKINFVEVYQPDGRITYKDDLKGDLGHWSVRGSTFCTFYDRINGACWYVLKRSVNCYEFFPASADETTPVTRETLLGWQPDARAARDAERVSCDAWYGS